MLVRSSAPSRLVLIAVLLLAVSAADAAPTPRPPAPGPSSGSPSVSPTGDGGGVLRYGLFEPSSIDPAFAASDAGLTVVDALFDPLTQVSPDGEVVGAAASDWEVSDDARTFIFTLRDARFHDGSPVRAEDFVRGFNRIVRGSSEREPAHPELLADVEGFAATHLSGARLAGVDALGVRTLRIRLDRPRADLPEVLSHPALVPVPPSADREPGPYGRRPVGNGPFRIEEAWEGGAEIPLARNDDHPGPPRLDGVTFVLYAGQDAEDLARRDLQDGTIDVSPFEASATDGRELAAVYAYGFVTDSPPFDDPVLRQAFSLAIDRTSLVETRDVVPADALLPPGIAGRRPGTCARCRFDRARAGLLMAGIPAPPVTLLVTDEPRVVAAAREVADDVIAATGIDVEVTSVPVAEYLDRLDAGRADVFGLRWGVRTPTPDDLLYRSFASRNVGVTNLTRYVSPEVDGLLEDARAATDRQRRLALYRRAEQRILDDAVVVPVWYDRMGYATREAVEDLTFDAWGRPDLVRVSLTP